MNFHVITLFPNAFRSYLAESIIARAQEKKLIKVIFYNPRDYTKDKWQRVDRRPYGGGPGMVLEPISMIKAVQAAVKKSKRNKKAKIKILITSPGGAQFSTAHAKKYADKFTDIIIVSGRYEGIDARVKKVFRAEDISIGPFVLTGGELPTMAIIDSVARQIEGVLGNYLSLEESRASSSEVYTRPEVLVHDGKKYRVPKVLLTGNHKKIEDWKRKTKNPQ